MDKVLSNHVSSHSWPCFVQGWSRNLLRSLLTWIILWSCVSYCPYFLISVSQLRKKLRGGQKKQNNKTDKHNPPPPKPHRKQTDNKNRTTTTPQTPQLLRLKKPCLSRRLKKSFSPYPFQKGEPWYLYHSWQIYSLHFLRFPLQSNRDSIASASNLSWYATILLRKVYPNSVSEICFAAV